MAEPARNQEYTWDDYRSWDDDGRWEIVGGDAYSMSPSPTYRHQRIVGQLYSQLRRSFGAADCEVMLSPLDVRLSEHDMVQPDLFVVCDPNQIKATHIEGPPALVVEILSPSSVGHDRMTKMRLYEKFGVKEYWIVTPYPHLAEVFSLDGESYRVAGVYGKKDTLISPRFNGLAVELDKVFDFPIPPEERVDEIRESTPPYVKKGSRSRGE